MRGLTLSLIIEAESANYGEGIGNVTTLKKIVREGGASYTYISRQALRYSMIKQLEWCDTPVRLAGENKKVAQFDPTANIYQYPEIDLFGYMKTNSKKDKGKDSDVEGKEEAGSTDTRSAVVRLSNAISLESFKSDMDFLTNMGLSTRNKVNSNSIVQSEIHKSFYTYTITIDLERVGEEDESKIGKEGKANEKMESITQEEKIERITKFLDVVQFLYRDIRGRRENLSPVFAIGGLYDRKNPFFENRLRLINNSLDCNIIKTIINSDDDIKSNTKVGYLNGILGNDTEIQKELETSTIDQLFTELKKEVEEEFKNVSK